MFAALLAKQSEVREADADAYKLYKTLEDGCGCDCCRGCINNDWCTCGCGCCGSDQS